jgi:tRNA1Val (adenine37-N6)-methyltransferase
MLAQRNVSAKISAIDINENAVKLASENFKILLFNERLKVELKDFKTLKRKKFDLVVCNPPFFEENNSAKDVLARQQVELNFRNLVEKSLKFYPKKGFFR